MKSRKPACAGLACLLVFGSATSPAQSQVVRVAPIIRQTATAPGAQRLAGPNPPASAARVDPGATFFIELWASNSGAPLDGLACLHADLSYDRTDIVDSVAPEQAGVNFPISVATVIFDDAAGTVDDLGGCQSAPPINELGVNEWVMVYRVEMTAAAVLDGPIIVSLSDTGNIFAGTAIIGQTNNLTPGQMDFQSRVFNIGDCAGPGDCDDADDCTDDSCVAGLCNHTNNTALCDDGDPCTTGESCSVGVCGGGTPVECEVSKITTVVTTTPTAPADARLIGMDPPLSAGNVQPNSTFYIELWASNGGPPLDGLACVHADLNYDRTDLIDSVSPILNGSLFPVAVASPVFDDASGNVGDAGGCQSTPPINDLGVGEWVLVDIIEMSAGPTIDGPITLTLADAANVFAGTSIVGQPTNLLASQIDFQSTAFFVGECTVAEDCDDGNVCTDDTCVVNVCQFSDNTLSCEDGDPCTTGEVCATGICGGGTPVDCSGLDTTCTSGVCNTISGLCDVIPANEGGACDDGTLCTENDACTSAICQGTAVDCSGLDDQCAVGVCDTGSGSCITQAANEGDLCDDSDPNTVGEVCQAGVCTGTLRVVRIAPVVLETPTPAGSLRFVGVDPPASVPMTTGGSPFFIELWAKNVDTPGDPLACAHVDIAFDRTDVVDIVGSPQLSSLFPVEILPASVDDPGGTIGNTGGCQSIPPDNTLGVGEWVMFKRVEMIALGPRAEVTVTLSNAGSVFVGTSLIGDGKNLPTDAIEFDSVAFFSSDCQTVTYGDVNADETIDLFDIFCVLDGFQDIFTDCSSDAVDLAPCGGDGGVDLFDILAVLDAFIAVPAPCPDPCISIPP